MQPLTNKCVVWRLPNSNAFYSTKFPSRRIQRVTVVAIQQVAPADCVRADSAASPQCFWSLSSSRQPHLNRCELLFLESVAAFYHLLLSPSQPSWNYDVRSADSQISPMPHINIFKRARYTGFARQPVGWITTILLRDPDLKFVVSFARQIDPSADSSELMDNCKMVRTERFLVYEMINSCRGDDLIEMHGWFCRRSFREISIQTTDLPRDTIDVLPIYLFDRYIDILNST